MLYAGRVVEKGPVDEVLSPPFHPYTKLLISSVPEMRVGWMEEMMQSSEMLAGIDRVVTITDVGCPFADRCPLVISSTCDKEIPRCGPWAIRTSSSAIGKLWSSKRVDLRSILSRSPT